MLDHSLIYRSRRLPHWHHRARLRQVLKEAAAIVDAKFIADVGCSNGYVTNLLSRQCATQVFGFDYQQEFVERGQTLYPHVRFRRGDLNRSIRWEREFDLVCCFETLEHVGNLTSALNNLQEALRTGGTLLVSVPVEVGIWGISKFLVKSLYGYSMDELGTTRREYLWALLSGDSIARFRTERYAWGTHFGFDWRDLEQQISERMLLKKAYTKFATRIIVAQKR